MIRSCLQSKAKKAVIFFDLGPIAHVSHFSHLQTALPVQAPVSGVIEELLVPDGEKVTAGTQLCKIRITGVYVCVCVCVCVCDISVSSRHFGKGGQNGVCNKLGGAACHAGV